MPFLPIIIAEIVSAVVIVVVGSPAHTAFPFVLAQEETTPASTANVSSPSSPPDNSNSSVSSSDQPSSSSSENTISNDSSASFLDTPPPQDTNTPNSSSAPDDGSLKSNGSSAGESLLQQSLQELQPSAEPTPTLKETKNENHSNTNQEPFTLDQTQQDTQVAAQTVLTSGDIVSGPAEGVDQKTQEKASKQEEQLANATTPEEKATLNIGFAKDSVKEAEAHIRSEDFATTMFITQRLSDQIDSARENAAQTKNKKQTENLKGFCRQADLLFRSQQLIIPEEAEQDFAIVRGKCLDILQ